MKALISKLRETAKVRASATATDKALIVIAKISREDAVLMEQAADAMEQIASPLNPSREDFLTGLIDDISDYMLDNCPEGQNWEDFDPDLDEVRTYLQEMRGY